MTPGRHRDYAQRDGGCECSHITVSRGGEHPRSRDARTIPRFLSDGLRCSAPKSVASAFANPPPTDTRAG